MKKSVLAVGLLVLMGAGFVLGWSLQSATMSPPLEDQNRIEAPIGAVYPMLALTRVIDGDTYEMWLHIAPRLAYFADVRLVEVDTPEIRGECSEQGERVKELVADFLNNASVITAQVVDVDQYGRWVSIVTVDGVDLSTWIVDQGLTKQALCSSN